jgi:hypothetical protein
VKDPVAVAQFGTATPKPVRNPRQYRDHEPTEEELERIIAEQRKRLPSWWPRDGTKDVDPEGDE